MLFQGNLNFPENVEGFRTVCTITGHSVKCSRPTVNFPDAVNSGQSGKIVFPQ